MTSHYATIEVDFLDEELYEATIIHHDGEITTGWGSTAEVAVYHATVRFSSKLRESAESTVAAMTAEFRAFASGQGRSR